MDNIFLIAEIGINHNGEIKIAKELIKAASEAGFDSVKFQKRDVETVYNTSIEDGNDSFEVENNICIENQSDFSDIHKIPCNDTPSQMKNGCFPFKVAHDKLKGR